MATIKSMLLTLVVVCSDVLADDFKAGSEFADRSFASDSQARSSTALAHALKAEVAGSKKGSKKSGSDMSQTFGSGQTVVIGSTICMPGACNNSKVTSWAEIK